jgi:hypothetical protein
MTAARVRGVAMAQFTGGANGWEFVVAVCPG